jgi:putative Holliday junction resolvase
MAMTRILGLDFGSRRVGAAVSDPGHSIATPLEVYERRNPRLDETHYREVIAENDVDRIVLGLPLHTGGGESESSAQARRWGTWLGGVTGLPVVFFDERYTSVDAEDVLRSAGIKLKNRRDKRDMLAARILLQNYLDAGCPLSESSPVSLIDEPTDDRDD